MPSSYDAYVTQLQGLQRQTADNVEYWLAREIQILLAYETWRNFDTAIRRAMAACESAGQNPLHHFAEAGKMVAIGSGAQRETADWFLSRYACYLIAMNSDPTKPEVGYAQTYFALQTRRQERHDELTEVERRRELRGRVKDANKGLGGAAKDAGVQRFAIFYDAGYKGLYGGHGVADVKAIKGIREKDDLLDCIGDVELAANYFRITQTEQKLKRDGIHREQHAIDVHREVGRQVRDTMQKISGTKPEELPAAPSLKRLKVPAKQKALPARNEDQK